MYECQSCKTAFDSFFSLRAHQNGNRRDGIQQCELKNKLSGASAEDHEDGASVLGAPSDFVISNPFDIKYLICRRQQSDSTLGVPQPLCNVGSASLFTYTGSINYGKLVEAFTEYCKWVLQSRSTKFWSLYLKTRHLPQEDQRELLLLIRKLFPGNTTTSRKWCPDKRAVRYLLAKKPFWPLVTYTYTCDLSAFKVPGLGSVRYTFIDPIFAWIIQARKVCKKHDLLFRYREARIRGERTWGSCVSCGLAMRQVKLSGRGPRYFY